MARTAQYVQQKLETMASIKDFMEGKSYPKYPANVFLEASNLCDLKCAMCGPFSALNSHRMFALKEDRGFMQTPDGLNLEDLFAHALRLQLFGYGEPTLNPSFPDFLKLAGHYETLINFFTNGMHFTPELCEAIVTANVREVCVSFSGAEKALYENIYIGGDWEKVMAGIRRLADEKIKQGSQYPVISINSIAYEHHVRDFVNFTKMMYEQGANVIYLKPLIAVPTVPQLAHYGSIYREWGPEGDILREAHEFAYHKIWLNTHLYKSAGAADQAEWEDKRAAFIRSFNLDPDAMPEYVPVETLKAVSRTVPMIKPPKDYVPADEGILGYGDPIPAVDLGVGGLTCMEPFYTFYVRKDLEVKPCCNAYAPTDLGRVSKTLPLDIWNGVGFEETRRLILEGNYPRMCHGCIKSGNAHAAHHFTDDVNEYMMWYQNVFQEPLPEVELRTFEDLGSSPDIAARWHPETREQEQGVDWEQVSWARRILRRAVELVR